MLDHMLAHTHGHERGLLLAPSPLLENGFENELYLENEIAFSSLYSSYLFFYFHQMLAIVLRINSYLYKRKKKFTIIY
jgi:hypothetical protein